MRKPQIEKITPSMAIKILTGNTVNRVLTDSWVSDYSHRMKTGTWNLSPDPICIGKNGEVYNGQHRLWAIVDSDTTQTFWVFRDCAEEIVKVIDAGKIRTLRDRVTLFGDKISSRHLAIIKGFYGLPGLARIDWTPDLITAAEKKAKAHIDFAEEVMVAKDQRHRLGCAAFIVAMARAHMEELSEIELRGFAKVFMESIPSEIRTVEVDSSVRHLRDKVLSDTIGPIQGKFQAAYYFMLTKAIVHFMNGSAPSKVYKTDNDPFPLRKIYKAVISPSIVEISGESFKERQSDLLEKKE